MNAVTEAYDWKKTLASSTTRLRIKQLTEELKVQAYTAISRKVVVLSNLVQVSLQ